MPEADLFVSYRREDSRGYARGLFNHLNARFAGRVFLDWEGIELGEDFVAKLTAMGRSCKVLLALIGPRWLGASDAQGQSRLEQPSDFVRQEIALALERRIPVIPVLLGGATMPSATELPEALRDLSRCNAMAVTDANYAGDLERLTRGIEALLGESPGTVVHGVRRERDWTSATAFGKEVQVEFTMTPQRKHIVWMTAGVVALALLVFGVVVYLVL